MNTQRTQKKKLFICTVTFFIFMMLALIPKMVCAGYPFISDIPNQWIDVNDQTSVITFRISDDTTSPDDLTLSYKSGNTDLVPGSDSNITLGGSGSTRTVQITPASGKWGMAPITIIVTDTDGDSNQDSFEVNVRRAPR